MDKVQKGEIIFVRLLLPLCLGIWIAEVSPNTINQAVIGLAIGLLLAFTRCVLFYTKFRLYLNRWKPGLITYLLILVLGIWCSLANNEKLHVNHFTKSNHEALVVRIISEPKLRGDILRFEGKVRQGLIKNSFIPLSGSLLLALKLERKSFDYQYGDELLIKEVYTEVEPPYNPYEFDFKSYLAYHGIFHQSFINEPQVQVLGRSKANPVIAYALSLRKNMVRKYELYITNKEASSVISTLILGYKAELSKDVLSAYSKTGTMHVLSVSGMHVGIVFLILNALLRFMNRNQGLRILRAVLIIALIWFYSLISGFSPSVCRAALMLSIFVFGKALNRSSNSYNLIASSAFLLLIYNPCFLFDAGFQLSYLAVLGLIYFYPKIYHLFYIKNWLGDKIWSYTALSCAAQLATFPISLFYFHQFPVYFLASNLFIVLPVTIIMYLGIAFLFIPWHTLLKPLGRALEKGIILMDQGLFYIEQLPLANIASYHFSFLPYFIMYLLIAGFFMSFQYRSKQMVYGTMITWLMLVTYISFDMIKSHKEKSVTFFSLKKHTAFAVFEQGNAYVYSDLDSIDKTLDFSVYPFVHAKALNISHFSITERSRDKVFSDGNFFRFNNWQLLLWNKEINQYRYQKNIKVNALLLSGSPKVKIADLLKQVQFKILIIDGTNPDYAIKSWTREASQFALNYYVLKKNPAYNVTLDKGL